MDSNVVAAAGSFVLGTLVLANVACGIVGPSCTDESGAVLNVNGQVGPGGVTSYSVTSPKNSNLFMRLTWTDTTATVGLRATITSCGGHTGCTMDMLTPTFGPGGSSPIPLPWPAGLREMQVDGSKGKTYRVEITGDGERDAGFALDVRYQIDCER
jgi:hypothetical protein